VGSFIVVVPRLGAVPEAEDLFLRASCVIQEANRVNPVSTISNAWSFAAFYRRLNGAGTPMVQDARTGSWLVAIGTLFHQSGNNRAEHLLQQYLRAGARVLASDLDGFFVVVVGDARSREVVVITDIVGSLHCYNRKFRHGIALSTSSLVLAQLDAVSLNAAGCQEFLGTGIIYEDRTLYNEVGKLPPATIATFRDGRKVNYEQYWNLSSLTPESIAPAQAIDALWENLTSAVGRVSQPFDSIACDLTGGYDSRSIAAAFLQNGRNFTTVVSGLPNTGDVVVSRGLAKMLGLEHLHYPPIPEPITSQSLDETLWLTDGEYDLVEYIRVARIHRDLSQRFQISINGSFGEVARGYWWELLLPHTGARTKLDSYKVSARRYALSSAGTLVQPQYRVSLVEHIRGVIDRTTAGFETHPNTFQMDVAYLRMRMQRWQGRIASSTNRIWPCLSPFMFRMVLETMLQAQYRVRRRSLLVRRMLARYQPSLAAYPLEHGNPALPATLRSIHRFWPVVPYYAGRVVGKIERKLLPASSPSQSPRLQLWELDEVKSLLQPGAMKSMAILDPAPVTEFLKSSQTSKFSQDAEWCRLLTLEWALSRVPIRDAG
jgi:asparagine synthase (glutamine-hydrolysing)